MSERNGRWILPENARLPRSIQGSFTCRKYTTWDRRLYFLSEGRRAEDFFFALKNPTASVGFEPANLGTRGQHATSRPSKPLSFNLVYDKFGFFLTPKCPNLDTFKTKCANTNKAHAYISVSIEFRHAVSLLRKGNGNWKVFRIPACKIFVFGNWIFIYMCSFCGPFNCGQCWKVAQ